MTFDDLIDSRPADVDDAIRYVISDYHSYMNEPNDRVDSQQHFRNLLHYYTILYSIVDNDDGRLISGIDHANRDDRGYLILGKLDFTRENDVILDDIRNALRSLEATNDRIIAARDFESIITSTKVRMGKIVSYKFSDDEVGDIQRLISKLRQHIVDSSLFDAGHRRRLMLRLEALQRELHKKMSDLDRFWGLIGDAGIALGKFGSNAQPFVDMIKELTAIVWRAQARTEEIDPSNGPPLLSKSD